MRGLQRRVAIAAHGIQLGARRFAVRIVTSDASEAAAPLKAPARLEPDRREANAARVVEFGSGRGKLGIGRPVALRAESHAAFPADVRSRWRVAMRLPVAMTSLAMHAGHRCRSMTAETTLRVRLRLHYPERGFEIRRRLRFMTRREAEPVALPVPGHAMLHKASVALDDRSDGLNARAERPRDGGLQRVPSARNRDLVARIRVAGSRALAQLASVEVLARVGPQRVRVRRGRLLADALGMAWRAHPRIRRGAAERYCDSENKSR